MWCVSLGLGLFGHSALDNEAPTDMGQYIVTKWVPRNTFFVLESFGIYSIILEHFQKTFSDKGCPAWDSMTIVIGVHVISTTQSSEGFRGHVILEKWLLSWVVLEFFGVATYCLGPARIPCENYSSAPKLMNLGKTWYSSVKKKTSLKVHETRETSGFFVCNLGADFRS